MYGIQLVLSPPNHIYKTSEFNLMEGTGEREKLLNKVTPGYLNSTDGRRAEEC